METDTLVNSLARSRQQLRVLLVQRGRGEGAEEVFPRSTTLRVLLGSPRLGMGLAMLARFLPLLRRR